MSKFIVSNHGFGELLTEYFCSDPFQTTNATPFLITSIPVAINSTSDIEVYMRAVKNDGSMRNCGSVRGVFSRTLGNISQDGSLAKDLRGTLSKSDITFTLNQTTKEVEIYAIGIANTTIDWTIGLEITHN